MMNNKFYQFLGLTKKSRNLIEGYNKCEEAIKKEKIYLIILSKECSENTKKKFRKISEEKSVQLIEDIPKNELGKPLGREEINVLCVKDNNMSKKLIELWNNHESI
ncbi:50S ribosomal protein L7ae-like protein [Clostridium senegalense]|uniref:50S ribosomal protein L7ae-like protein n=1 Tax=Clostridium senegalense TaxID=1465809 RepID=UPI0004746F29|nr:50S ribosomal protein L7ae-like protein [Clostridium senegalense]